MYGDDNFDPQQIEVSEAEKITIIKEGESEDGAGVGSSGVQTLYSPIDLNRLLKYAKSMKPHYAGGDAVLLPEEITTVAKELLNQEQILVRRNLGTQDSHNIVCSNGL